MNTKKILSLLYLGSTGILGFKRGVHNYSYNLEKMNQRYDRKEEYFYSTSFCEGMMGSVLYMTPAMIFFLHKEIYRLEVNLRNLEDEKKTDYYNRL